MTTLTKDAIKNSLMKLLNRKPLNKITVKEIVEDCGINRNSFYYHFDDIPSLVEEIFNDQADALLQLDRFDSIYECLMTGIHFALENKTAMMHVYNSANREMFERYLSRVSERTVVAYIDRFAKDLHIAGEDFDAITLYYKSLLIGFVIDWLGSGMKYDLTEKLRRICVLFDGTFESAVKKSRGEN